MRRALAIDEKSFGPDHPNVATALNNLARFTCKTKGVGGKQLLSIRRRSPS